MTDRRSSVARSRRIALPALAVGVAVTTLAGIAVAAIPSASGVIHACYGRSSHDLRVVSSSHCKSSEKALSWNVAGPRGKTGPRGPKGNTGPAGPTSVLADEVGAGVDIAAGDNAEIASLVLPAGKYLVSGHAVVESEANPVSASCVLGDGVTTASRSFVTAPLLGPVGDKDANATLSEEGVLTTAGSTLKLSCFSDVDASTTDISIIATPVQTITLTANG